MILGMSTDFQIFPIAGNLVTAMRNFLVCDVGGTSWFASVQIGDYTVTVDRSSLHPKSERTIRKTTMANPQTTATIRTPVIDDTYLQAVRQVETLIAFLKNNRRLDETLGEVLSDTRMILDALPLSRDDYAIAGNRLGNAVRYLKSNERGAACYELNLLYRSLVNDRHYLVAIGRCEKLPPSTQLRKMAMQAS